MTRTQALHKLMLVIGLLFILLVVAQAPAATLHHSLAIELLPTLKMIKGESTITFPADTPRKLTLVINKNLKLQVVSPDDLLTVINRGSKNSDFAEYGLSLGTKDHKVSLKFSGIIHDPVVNDESRGLISLEGATLFGESYWHPQVLGTQSTFDISVTTPRHWRSLTQGQLHSVQEKENSRTMRYVEIYPQETIYLTAADFFQQEVYLKNGIKVQVLFRKNEPTLAPTYLNLVSDYINHYSQLIGPYPYTQFSVVENFWETGFGMPGFTLLGPMVLRLPFILTSSLPHEVLHSWWGNSVYVDYDKGNWSEGLTTYMADHWQQDKNGTAATYRLNSLIQYSDFVTQNSGKDFPLRQFKGRHNSSSQAIGYSKSLMFFRMLEVRLGSALFNASLQDFYSENRFKKASFEDLQKSFEKVSGLNLQASFTQWLDRTGAATLNLSRLKTQKLHDKYVVSFELEQNPQELYDLVVPLQWHLDNGQTITQSVALSQAKQEYSFTTADRPRQLAIDPQYDIFRHLYLEERPATLSSVFGAKNIYFYSDKADAAAQGFIKVWKQSLDGVAQERSIKDLALPATDGALVLVGDATEFKAFMAQQLQGQSFHFDDDQYEILEQSFTWNETSSALVSRIKLNPKQVVVWVRWSADNNPTEWASRLTHYSSTGILIFRGRPAVLRSTWPVLQSPLKINF